MHLAPCIFLLNRFCDIVLILPDILTDARCYFRWICGHTRRGHHHATSFMFSYVSSTPAALFPLNNSNHTGSFDDLTYQRTGIFRHNGNPYSVMNKLMLWFHAVEITGHVTSSIHFVIMAFMGMNSNVLNLEFLVLRIVGWNA
ncbi:hypothetical protein ACJX0J_015830, partial [Zea mays]